MPRISGQWFMGYSPTNHPYNSSAALVRGRVGMGQRHLPVPRDRSESSALVGTLLSLSGPTGQAAHDLSLGSRRAETRASVWEKNRRFVALLSPRFRRPASSRPPPQWPPVFLVSRGVRSRGVVHTVRRTIEHGGGGKASKSLAAAYANSATGDGHQR